MNTAEQSARLRVAMDAPLQSCCEYHALPGGCRQGRDCPERAAMPTPEQASGWLVALVLCVFCAVAGFLLAALLVSL